MNEKEDTIKLIGEVFGNGTAEYVQSKWDAYSFETFTAYKNNKIVGCALASDSLYGMKELSKLAVRPDFRGNGIASGILDEIKEKYGSKGLFGECVVNHPWSQKAFEKEGALPVGFQPKKIHLHESLTIHTFSEIQDGNDVSKDLNSFYEKDKKSITEGEKVKKWEDQQFLKADVIKGESLTGRIYNSPNQISIIKQLDILEECKFADIENFVKCAKQPWMQADVLKDSEDNWIFRDLGFRPIASMTTKFGKILRLVKFDGEFPGEDEVCLTDESRKVYGIVKSFW